jgi:hypothetical protein
MKKLLSAIAILSTVGIVVFAPAANAASIKFSYTKIVSKTPCQNATVTYSSKVVTAAGKAVAGVRVTIRVYYKSTSTPYTAGYTNASGTVSKKFKIGRATPNYKVVVKSAATKGTATTVTTTYFIPKKCS